jgi:hypothetical protein
MENQGQAHGAKEYGTRPDPYIHKTVQQISPPLRSSDASKSK